MVEDWERTGRTGRERESERERGKTSSTSGPFVYNEEVSYQGLSGSPYTRMYRYIGYIVHYVIVYYISYHMNLGKSVHVIIHLIICIFTQYFLFS